MFLPFIWALAPFYSVFSTAHTQIIWSLRISWTYGWNKKQVSNYQNQVKPYKCDPFDLHNLDCILSTKHIYHQPQTVPLEVFRHPPSCWPMWNLASHVSNHLYALIPLQDCYNPCVYCWLVEKQHPLCSKQAFWRSRDTHCPLKPQRRGVGTPFTRIPPYE